MKIELHHAMKMHKFILQPLL